MRKPIPLLLAVTALVATLTSELVAQQPAAAPSHGVPQQLPPGAVVIMPAPAQYPQMHAPMYPSPLPNVPVQMGGTVYTNQAFAPHEMLYPHRYKALFPPFYYKVSGKWWWTPFGMESHDKWELQGTEVNVRYRGSYRPFSGFIPPVSR